MYVRIDQPEHEQAKWDKKFEEMEREYKKELENLEEKNEKNLQDLKTNFIEKMKLKDEEYAEQINKMMKIIARKNYESHYPIPERLNNHIQGNQNSFNIQILGCRGSGKSTFVNKIMRKADLRFVAETGCNETTKETAFYDITKKVVTIIPSYDNYL